MNFFRKISPGKRPAANKQDTNPRPAKAGRVLAADGQEESCYSAVDSPDSDNEPSHPVRMDWRTDPEKSLSDWKIEIVSWVSGDDGDDTKQSHTYNVHKNVLILESEYFQRSFRAMVGNKGEGSAANVTRLELPVKAAGFFPDLLDYLYGQPPKFSSENATVFHYFGHYFGIRRLRWEAKQFWQQDITQDSVSIYYEDAITFGDPKVMTTLQKKCCSDAMIIGFERDSDIFKVADARLWLYLVKNVGPRHSEKLSEMVAWYLNEHGADSATFLELTAPDRLPKIDFGVTFFLLEMEQSLFVFPNDKLTTLQSRCLETLQLHWRDVSADDPGISTFLLQQPAIFLAELYKRTLSVVQELIHDDLEAFADESKQGSHSSSCGEEEEASCSSEAEEEEEQQEDTAMDDIEAEDADSEVAVKMDTKPDDSLAPTGLEKNPPKSID
jgi:hypothetical protein